MINYFSNHVEKYSKENNIDNKSLLLVDNAPAHPQQMEDWCENVQVVFLPPNTTSLLQPMDQGVIAAFKAYYVKHTMLQLIKKTDKDKLSIKEFWRTYNIKMALENIEDSWAEASASTMNAVWKKVWPECVHNFTGFADVPLITSQIVDLAQEAGFEEVDEEDVDDLLESHAEPLSNEDLMELEQQWALEEEEDAVTPSSEHLTMKNLSQILSSFESAIEFVIEQDPNLERSTDFSCVVYDALCCYKERYAAKKKKAIQPTLHAFFKPKDAAPTPSTIQDAPSTSCQETVPAGEESDSTVSSEEGDDSATPQVWLVHRNQLRSSSLGVSRHDSRSVFCLFVFMSKKFRAKNTSPL